MRRGRGVGATRETRPAFDGSGVFGASFKGRAWFDFFSDAMGDFFGDGVGFDPCGADRGRACDGVGGSAVVETGAVVGAGDEAVWRGGEMTREQSRRILDQLSVGERFMLMFGRGELKRDPLRVEWRAL